MLQQVHIPFTTSLSLPSNFAVLLITGQLTETCALIPLSPLNGYLPQCGHFNNLIEDCFCGCSISSTEDIDIEESELYFLDAIN